MIQDIAPHIYKNEYKPQRPADNSYIMYFKEGKLLARIVDEEIEYPTFGEMTAQNADIYEEATYLFTIDDMRFYLVERLEHDDTYEWIKKETFRQAKPLHLAFAGITAYQLHSWYEHRKFCGKCGHPMKKDEKERMLFCESCRTMEFPKICPAVIVGVTDGNRLLITKYARRTGANYALVAGFAEIGETIEETVRREVMEEVGLKVKNITYYKSQPWSFSDTLLFGFYCEVDGSSEIVLDEKELAEGTWFEREEIPVTEKTVSLTNEMILNFKYGE